MTRITLSDLPPPPSGSTGWPWTEASEPVPATRPDGGQWPRITIVTPSYNQGEFIEETIRSVLLQGYPNLEYFIIDGGSNDNSVEIINKYSKYLTYWQSKKDNGQPDAINIALRRATGLWFHNVNSDDILIQGALFAIGSAPLDADNLLGEVIEFCGNKIHLVKNHNIDLKMLLHRITRSADQSWHQPGVIFKSENLKKIGGYTTELQYTFDLHATCRYFERFSNSFKINRPIIRFRIHGNQKSSAWGDIFRTESIVCRLMLSKDLLQYKYRSLARFEAQRLNFLFQVVKLQSAETCDDAIGVIQSIVKEYPSLAIHRMLLGNFRRHPVNLLKFLSVLK